MYYVLQGRYEYCFCVDGAWTHDPDLPAIKNDAGHYSNMLKIVDPRQTCKRCFTIFNFQKPLPSL